MHFLQKCDIVIHIYYEIKISAEVIFLEIKNVNHADKVPCDCNKQSFVIKHGTGGIMFSAPHNVEQTREGKIKYSEPHTGILAEALHKKYGCPVIIKTANCNDDANFDPVSDYRDELIRYINENNIRFLIDLHQLTPTRDVMINFGTATLKNIDNISQLNIFLSEFSKNKLGIIQVDEPFGAFNEYTVSSAVRRECGIPCVQLEINSRLVCSEYSEYAPETVFEALSGCLLRLKELYNKG